MAYINNQQINTGSFVPTTNIWDVAQLYEVEVNSPEFKELLVRLYQNINTIALVLNTKVSGILVEQEFVNGKIYSLPMQDNPIQGWQRFIVVGALPAGVTTVAHGIPFDTTYAMISITGAASNTATLTYYPIGAPNGGANDIQVSVNNTNVVITNNSGVSFDRAYVVLEYIKN